MRRGSLPSQAFLISWLGVLASLGLAALLAQPTSWMPWAAAAALGALASLAVSSLVARRRAPSSPGTAPEPAPDAATEGLQKRLAEAGRAAAERAEALSAAMDALHSHDEAHAREARMAARMQRRIVPKPESLPSRRETAFGAVYLPAENTGGDLYDAFRAGKNGLALLAADVSGRGVTAALIAAMVKNAFRSKVCWDADPAAIMAAVGEELFPILGDTDHFVTAFLATLDLETGVLRHVSAGHPPALLYRRRRGTIEELDSAGPPLGLQAEAPFVAGERRLEEGDRLLLFTDGLTGARNYRGEAFGRDRLVDAFQRSAPRLPAEAANVISSALESFLIGAPRPDDVVALVCEFSAFARPEAAARRRLGGSEDWQALAKRGGELASAGKIEEAVAVYERLLELEPEDAASLNNLGTLYWRLGRREEAAARFEAAARLDPGDPRIKRNLALAERARSALLAGEEGEAPTAAPAPGGETPRKAGAAAPLGAAVEDAEPVDEARDAEPLDEVVEEAEPLDEDEAVEDAEPLDDDEVEDVEPIED